MRTCGFSLLIGLAAMSATAATRSSSGFNTDYRTRRGAEPGPATLRGGGIGGRNLPLGQEDAWRRAGQVPADYAPTDLVRLPPAVCYSGMVLYLRREAAESMARMCYDAARQGFQLQVVSAYRDSGHQARLYAEAVRRRGTGQKTVARPGRSEHLLGTTADVTDAAGRGLLNRGFANTPEGRWVACHGHLYGWKMTVLASGQIRSHADEPWHIRYLGSAARAPRPNELPAGYACPVGPKESEPRRRSVLGGIGRLIGIGRDRQ